MKRNSMSVWKAWMEGHVGTMTEKQFADAMRIMQDDLSINENIPLEQIEGAIGLVAVYSRVFDVLPICAGMVIRCPKREDEDTAIAQ